MIIKRDAFIYQTNYYEGIICNTKLSEIKEKKEYAETNNHETLRWFFGK